MTELENFVRHAETDLHLRRTMSEATSLLWVKLPTEQRSTFAPVLSLLGCAEKPEPKEHRIAAARLLLLQLRLDTDEPRWSSSILDRIVEVVRRMPGGNVGDLYDALFEILGAELPIHDAASVVSAR